MESVRAAGADTNTSALTGLRFFAAASIFLGHFYPTGEVSLGSLRLDLGSLTVFGMPLFFILSGFVIHFRYSKAMARPSGKLGALADFFGARFARLAPLYLFFFCVYFYIDGWLTPALGEGQATNFLALSLTPVYSWLPHWYHSGLQAEVFFGVSWSVSTEVFFYCCYPLYGGILRRVRSFRVVAVVTALFCTSVYIWLWLVFRYSGQWEAWASTIFPGFVWASDDWNNSFERWFVYISPYTRMFEFVLGVLTAQLFLVLGREPAPRRELRIGTWLSAAALLAIVALYFLLECAWSARCVLPNADLRGFVSFLHMNFLFAVPFAAFIFCAARYPVSPVSRFLATRVLVYLGEISYSLYLSQQLAIYIVDHWLKHTGSWWYPFTVVALKTALVFIISVGTYTFVELPSREWLRRGLRGAAMHPMGGRFVCAALALPITVGFVLWGTTFGNASAASPPIEPRRTTSAIRSNLVWPSERLRGGSWFDLQGATVRFEAGAAPEYHKIADALVEDNSVGLHRISISVPDVDRGSLYSFSIYVKPYGDHFLRLEMRDQTSANYGVANFDLDADRVSARQGRIEDPAVTRLQDGWLRISAAAPCSTKPVIMTLSLIDGPEFRLYKGDGKSGTLLWGAQVSPGSKVQSYTATTKGPIEPSEGHRN